MSRAVAVVIAGIAAGGLASTGSAHADNPLQRPEAFEVDRDAPPPGQAELGFDGGAPIRGWAISAQGGYIDRPLTLTTNLVVNHPVEHRQTLALGGAYALTPNLIVDARMPFDHQVGDRYRGLGDNKRLDRFVLGDIALGARLRLAERGAASIFARGALTIPSGDDHDFAGEARFTAAWNLIVRVALPAGLTVAATAGVKFRPREVQVADRLLGDELSGGFGAIYELPPLHGLWCAENHTRLTAEIVGVLGNDVAGQRGPSPAEVRIGMGSDIRSWLSIAGRIGKGIDDEIGAPRFRGMLELVYRGN
jgi:hypothetical protein